VQPEKIRHEVRDEVLAATGRMQEPFVYDSLPGENFYFRWPGGWRNHICTLWCNAIEAQSRAAM
jgi:hypothetical protein